MPTPQSGVLAEANSHASFILLSVSAETTAPAQVRAACREIPALTAEVAAMDTTARLSSVVAVSADAWSRLHPEQRPQNLSPFRARSQQGRIAPATPGDLLLHIRSERRDLNYLLLKKIMQRLAGCVSTVEEVDGFRYLDSRDLTGFVDGTENPEGDERAEVALVDDDAAFNGGSYIHLQRYVHDLDKWESLAVGDQEAVIGRTRDDNVEMDAAHKPPTAHISRVVIKEDGDELEILRHSMPYANSRQAGLLFIAYAKTPHNFERMLDAMMLEGDDKHYDHLMDYTRAVSGVALFAPSVELLQGG